MPKSPTRSSPNWRSPLALPKNAATQRRYSGINVLILWGALIERGFAGQNWLTFRQALGLGGNVRKHASVAAFEGYAGSSKSGFRAEVEAQRALGQIDDILDYFDDRRAGGSPSGPAGPRIARTLDAAGDTLGPLPAMIADRARLRTLLASLARTLHVGPLADCFFDPSTALCLKRTTASDRTTPLIALCEPTRCPNACLTQRHRPVWERAAADAARFLGLSGRTLEKHRTYGTGPHYSKLGGRVVYRLDDLQAWGERGAKASTSDPGAGEVLPAKRHAVAAPDFADVDLSTPRRR